MTYENICVRLGGGQHLRLWIIPRMRIRNRKTSESLISWDGDGVEFSFSLSVKCFLCGYVQHELILSNTFHKSKFVVNPKITRLSRIQIGEYSLGEGRHVIRVYYDRFIDKTHADKWTGAPPPKRLATVLFFLDRYLSVGGRV